MDDKVLIYTVSRAASTERVSKAFRSLLTAQTTAGFPHEWILWCNSPEMLDASRFSWPNGQIWNDGVNTGQHVALNEILKYARSNDFTHICKVDDDLEWMTKNWLKKLMKIHSECFKESGKNVLLSPRIKGLKNPIPIVMKLELPSGAKIYNVPIIGGACRLHHISFFDNYIPDCRRALGAGGDTSINQHAESIEVGSFVTPFVNIKHQTAKMESEDPGYFQMHSVYQSIPFIPKWTSTDAEKI